jgi:nitroreductase
MGSGADRDVAFADGCAGVGLGGGTQRLTIYRCAVELQDTLKRRRMIRSFRPDPVDREVLDRIVASVLHAPSAGFSQGTELLVLEDPSAVAAFWDLNEQPDFPTPAEHVPLRPPVVVVVLSNPDAYTERYAAPDKIAFRLDHAGNWPVPYWDVDAGMATMLMLLAVVEEGLGAFFAGLADGGRPTLDHFGVPGNFRTIGFVGLGHPAEEDIASAGSSAFKRRRRPVAELVHTDRW